MCTAVYINGGAPMLGRTLDYECSFGEKLAVIPRGYPLSFTDGTVITDHGAIMGMAYTGADTPLFYDAVNSVGLAAAALNFRGFAKYFPPRSGARNIASFELIARVLASSSTVAEAEELLCDAVITDASFSDKLPTMPLHWIIADRERAIVVEQTERGLHVYQNPFGVLANSPPFDFHLWNVSQFTSLDAEYHGNRLCPVAGISVYSRGFGAMGLPGDYSSPSRFVRALFCAEKTHLRHSGEGRVNDFFHVMDSVAVPRGCIMTDAGSAVMTYYTSCMTLDDPAYYLTTYASRQIRRLRLSDFDYGNSEISVIDVSGGEKIQPIA